MSRLSIALLGHFQVSVDGQPVSFPTDKAQALLAYLAVESARPHRRDALAGLLWPDQPQDKARQSLRQALFHLRQTIADSDEKNGQPFLLVDRHSIQFNTASDHSLDVAVFQSLVHACRVHQHRRLGGCLSCLQRLRELVDLYRCHFLDQFFLSDSAAFEEWALLQREWFRREAVKALFQLADYHERRGEYADARRYARRQLTLEPWREEAHRQLMRLLAMEGERSAALAQYEACRRILAQELNVEPMAETQALHAAIRDERTVEAPVKASLHGAATLPRAATPFVGRQRELDEIAEALANADCRLMTIFGPGGIGKTRLALQVAQGHLGLFTDGVYFASLSSISPAGLIAPAVADALAFQFQGPENEEEQLLNYLREKDMLLVLDGLEHLILPPSAYREDENGVKLVVEILKHAPGVILLVTSRERLNLQQEWTYEVEGLVYPADEVMPVPVEELMNYSAIQLFVHSARRAQHRFHLTESQAAYVVRICRLVEGMPLGIELAAAGIRTQPCRVIAREIERNLDDVATRLRDLPDRHRSIRATFEHSWRLLTEEERRVLAQLSVFRGGFRQESAVAVTGTSPATLAALLDKSLVSRPTPERFDMHTLLRQYASEKLSSDPETNERTQARHARHLAAFLERQAIHLKGPHQRQALLRIAPEIENIHQAWQWAVSNSAWREIDHSLESLYRFFDVQGRFQEGIDLLAQAIDRWATDSEDAEKSDVLGRLLSRQGALYSRIALYQKAQRLLERGLDIAERRKATAEQVFGLLQLANIARHQGQYEETERLAQESLILSQENGNLEGEANSLLLMGIVRYRTGDIDQAEALLTKSLSVSRENDDPRSTMSALNTLGDIACHRGDFDEARAAFEECLALSYELGDQFNTAIYLNNLGTLLHVLEKYEKAEELYQESLEICRRIGDQIGYAIALNNMGRVAHERGAYPQAMAFCREGLTIGRRRQDQWTVMACLNNLGRTACAMGDYPAARAYLAEAVQLAQETQALTVLMETLVDAAVLFAGQDQPDRAAVLLTVAHDHPASERAVREKAQRLLDELDEADLAPPDSSPQSLEAIVAGLLAELCA